MNKFYDIDLPFGEIYEQQLKHIFGNKKFEVKTERDIWKTTGNICIELEYKGQPSGINITQADYWCHIFSDKGIIRFMMIFPVEELRKLVKNCKYKTLNYGGDNLDSIIALIPLNKVCDNYNHVNE